MKWEALTTGHGLLEGPVSDPAGRGLFFADASQGGVKLLKPDKTVETVIPGRRGIGGMAPHSDGGLIIGGRNIIHQVPGEEEFETLLESNPDQGILGFNDLTTDPAGRIFVGSLAFRALAGEEPKPGALHVIDLDGSGRVVAKGILTTNGMAFSPDGRLLYHNDTIPRKMWVYDIDEDGNVRNQREFTRIQGDGRPDGVVVTEDGAVWIAMADGGHILVLEPDASVRARIETPVPMVTNLCFVGDDRRDLYMTAGPEGSPTGGGVYRTRVDVPGLPVTPARVQPSRQPV